MLDEAARFLGFKEPHLSDEIVRKYFDPVEFVKTHTNKGGTAPEENLRLLNKRKRRLQDAIDRQKARISRLKEAEAFFKSEKEDICGSGTEKADVDKYMEEELCCKI